MKLEFISYIYGKIQKRSLNTIEWILKEVKKKQCVNQLNCEIKIVSGQ